ncbi:MAG TPA: tetratricopeptide repeat protein [Thermoanaerobaculia bacterium]|nr:tetratricopeptide repeat protein [Thermoanaerobaculia bacterium]
MHRALIIALLFLAAPLAAAPPSTCAGPSAYDQALCAYQRRQFAEAERAFRVIVEKMADEPATIRSMYFLGRTLMKQGHYDEAATLFIRIYSLDPPFYREWNCDFLLGECRRAQGKG